MRHVIQLPDLSERAYFPMSQLRPQSPVGPVDVIQNSVPISPHNRNMRVQNDLLLRSGASRKRTQRDDLQFNRSLCHSSTYGGIEAQACGGAEQASQPLIDYGRLRSSANTLPTRCVKQQARPQYQEQEDASGWEPVSVRKPPHDHHSGNEDDDVDCCGPDFRTTQMPDKFSSHYC